MPKITRETPLTGKTKSGRVLTEQEELFSNLYVQELGNGTAAAYQSYNCKDRTVAATIAKENLRKPHILERVRELLDLTQLNDETVDSELNFLLKQKSDLHAKKGAIEIYNKLKGRYAKDNEQKRPEFKIDKINYITPDGANFKTNNKTT